MNKLVKIKRQSKNIGLIGSLSKGKTMYQAYYTYLCYLKGYIVFSNIPLKFPHILIQKEEDLIKIRTDYDKNQKKIFLGDDLNYWYHSRKWKKNKLGELTIMWGKINCSCIYSTKRGDIDIDLREITDEFYFVDIWQYKDFQRTGYLNDCLIRLEGYNSETEPLPIRYLFGLQHIKDLYDTQHELQPINPNQSSKIA